MTLSLLLTWALLTLSLFNTILLLWLGIVVWFNAERRSWGIAVTAGGFILGSLFFISHSALLLSESLSFTRSNTLWLAVGMTPVVVLPFVWYVVLLWYSGYWTGSGGQLRQRHRKWVWLTTVVLVFGFVCLILLGIPHVPVLMRLTPRIWPWLETIKAPVLGIPLVAIGYPLYVLLCVALSLDALRRPGVTERVMGDVARRRARPWLVTASLLLFAVGVLVATVLVWTITHTRVGGYYVIYGETLAVIGRFDLLISLLVAAVTVLLGQAMTAYELFTGKALPRQGLTRQWKRAILLAAGYGMLIGGALAWGLRPIYAVLLTAWLMTAFFALLSWRSYVEWEHAMRQLRPFVASQHLYDVLLTAPDARKNSSGPFHALCSTVLDTALAHLIPAGPSAAFVVPQSYPADRPCPPISSLLEQSPETAGLITAIDPAAYDGALWAIPLWGDRGLTGMLLVGPRRGAGLYTQEEIEIARATGERIIDTAAGSALSQRLMQLQRERMATTQILDQRTRRVLHDEVLPLIHTAMLSLSAGKPTDVAFEQLSDAHQEISNLLRDLPAATTPDIVRLGLMPALRKMVNAEFAPAFDSVAWQIEDGVEAQAARLSPLAAETLYYATRELVRNAAKYGRPKQGAAEFRLTISAKAGADRLRLIIQDNGVGLGDVSEGGQGLALHSTLMAIAGGSLSVESAPGQMTRAELVMPLGNRVAG
ncbi:MAG: hypothetical protein CVU38_09555 [Chloroflexi bacterium HGW-Chloroflexi-1]|nr:MAG: hypothetical protein CVU38_09555 [Chloroflexi bacterium HGW-Chloroflexi-1]